MSFTVIIIGRPNVGKSTLFNRLVGKRLALVDPTPGVTRDRREGEGRIAHLHFTVIDTAGLEDGRGDALEARMRAQTERALADADVALMLIDARAGVTPLDEHFADVVRRGPTPVVLVANKCEGSAGEAGRFDAFALGLGEPLPISAEHGEGMGNLYDALAPYAGPEAGDDDLVDADSEAEADDESEGEREEPPLQLAVVGRPNVGKSTLINRLVGEDRLLTGPEAGITRDAIAVSWTYRGRAIRLVDTAGLRRKARVIGRLEGLAGADALRAVRFAHVVALMLDATEGLEKQDLTIARTVIDEGRALIIVANKWDAVADPKAARRAIDDRLLASFSQVRGLPVITCSAVTGRGVNRLLPTVLDTYTVWNRHVGTGPLNRWLADAVEHHPPPLARGRRVRLRYMTQAKTRPPTFVLFASRPEALSEGYQRYLINGLRDAFDLDGVPVRLLFRKGRNPYAPGK